MKKIYLLFILLFYFPAEAQFVTYFQDTDIAAFRFNGNDLYLMYEVKVSKTDAAMPALPVTDLFTGLNSPTAMEMAGSTMFLTEDYGGRVTSFNVTDASPSLTTVSTTAGSYPGRMLLLGDDMYLGAFDSDKIVKFAVAAAVPLTPTDVITGLNGPNGMIQVGDYVYVAVSLANKIVRFKPSDPVGTLEDYIVTGLGFPQSLAVLGNELFITNTFGNNLAKADMSGTVPTLTYVATLAAPTQMEVHDGYMYVVLRDQGRILRRPVSELGVSPNHAENHDVILYPNPADDVMHVANIQKDGVVKIYDLAGKQIKAVPLSSANDAIDVSALQSGSYLLSVDNLKPVRFIKN